MDTNQQDRDALNAKRCPDCGKGIFIEETESWCRSCDVWFESHTSGWIIRNRDAARYFNVLREARRNQRVRGKRKDI